MHKDSKKVSDFFLFINQPDLYHSNVVFNGCPYWEDAWFLFLNGIFIIVYGLEYSGGLVREKICFLSEGSYFSLVRFLAYSGLVNDNILFKNGVSIEI